MKHLETLDCDATGGWTSIGALETLTRVHAYRPKLDDLVGLARWRNLRELLISMGPLKSLEGIEAFGELEVLTLMALGLTSLEPAAGLPKVRRLMLRDMRAITDLGPIGNNGSTSPTAILAQSASCPN